MSLLNPIQIARGVSAADLAGQNIVTVSINGTIYTKEIPDPVGDYLWADRTTATDSLIVSLVTALNLAEFEEGTVGLWSVEWDIPTLGYYRLKRSLGQDGDDIQIQWNASGTTANPQVFGFTSDKATMTNGFIYSDYQCGLLWLPENFAIRWESRLVREGRTSFRAFDGKTRRYSLGGYRMWRLTLEEIAALFVYQDRSSRADYLCARDGVALGDPNVSWEGGTWRTLYDSEAPLRVWRDRDDLSSYVDVQPWRPEELDDMADSWKETRKSPQRYNTEMYLVEAL